MDEPEVIFENSDFVAINKPAGLMVHAARVSSKRRDVDEARVAGSTLVDWLTARWPEIKNVGDDPSLRPGIVHRLDKATSGVMIVAKTQASFEHLKKLFQEHRMRKTYYALVFGVPKNKSGVIDAPIGIKSGSLKRSVHSDKMAKLAVTEYSVVKEIAGENNADENEKQQYALLKVNPKTGRTHQIRVHLASIGHPIVGDALYGSKTSRAVAASDATGIFRSAPRLMLHAAALEFSDDAGNRFAFEVPLPDDFVH
jgi:23S rRNA pseudouridine1911/1915/1917 synthase